MIKPDDCSLEPGDLIAVEERAIKLLDKAEAWERYPVPIEDLLAAANVTVAPHSIFDPAHLLEYLQGKASSTANKIKSAVSKIYGLYDSAENIIHVDDNVGISKQIFLKLHETGHHNLPWHKKLFRFFQDCEQTLSPDISDQFEREANNFARFVLFKGESYRHMAAEYPSTITTPIKLAKHFGSSVYASVREFVRTNNKACVVFVLNPIEWVQVDGFRLGVRRIIGSATFNETFGQLEDRVITHDHTLGKLVPIGRKMSKPSTLVLTDRNGVEHECIGEAFDTTYNVFILIYPVRALTQTSIILP